MRHQDWPNPIVGGFLALRVDTDSVPQAVTWWMDGLQVEIGGSATTWQMGGAPTVQTGPTVVEFTSNYATCAACLDALSQAANFVWQIDAYKVLWVGNQGQQLALWSAGEGDMLRGSAQVEHSNPLYRNRQYILGALDQTTTQIETRIGDGTNTSFTLNYAVALVPTVEVKIGAGAFVAKTVGIGGVDTGKDWYWNGGKNVVFQDPAGTKLLAADTLRVTYVGQYPIVVLSTNDTEITAQLAREAGVGTGFVEDATGVASIKTRAGAYQVAAGYIAKFAQVGRNLTFHTYRGGLAPGQLLGVTLPDYGLAGEQMFVQSVSAQHDGLLHFDYNVTAIEGPINASWVQYFGALAAKGPTLVDSINLGGAGTTLALLQTFTATKAPTATFTTLVTACPICNTTLICGAATPIVC